MNKKMILMISILLFSSLAFAQGLSESDVSVSIEKLEKLPAANYLNEIAPLRESLQNYMLTKKRVCQGEFTTHVINTVSADIKLNEKEKIKCWNDLKGFEGSFIEALYSCRRRYLEYNHSRQLDELQKVREIARAELLKKY